MRAVRWKVVPYLFAAASIGFAGPTASASSGWTSFGSITELNQQPAAGIGSELVFVNVAVTSNPSNPASCTVRDGFYFAVTMERHKRLFAMLVAAQIAGRSVQVYVTDTCHPWGFAELDGVIVQ